jgi:membrane protein YqaA with SNARE-associated domain
VITSIVELFAGYGYFTLFILSFLASTLVPIGSEWFLIAIVTEGYDPVLSLMVATVGNTLGACTTYVIGLYGGPFFIAKILRMSDKSIQRAERFYAQYGLWSLLFSWVPFVGDPLCLVGGILRVRLVPFSVLVLVGKLARYAIVISMTMTIR